MIDDLGSTLLWMKAHGSSVLLNWGEDDDLWECSWIAGGTRFVGLSKYLEGAVVESLRKAGVDAATIPPTIGLE